MNNSISKILERKLKTNEIGQNIIFYDITDSTNNEAKRHSNLKSGTLIIADDQTDGKGRLGRVWKSNSGDEILMSLLLKPSVSPDEVSKITLIAGLSVCKALRNFGAKIKWPNDVIINSKKVAGVLTEMSAELNKINYIVCGIGININTTEFEEELFNKATSLYLTSGKKYDRSDILEKVLYEFESLYFEFLENGLNNILSEYKANCINLGAIAKAVFKDKTIIGKVVDINTDGELILETDNGKITISSGEVSVRGILGYV